MRFRGKSIRRKIVVLLLVPLVSLISIWGFATYITATEADRLLRLDEVTREVGDPAEETVQAIQRERRQILVYLADPRRTDGLTKLHKLQRQTDARVSAIRSNAAKSDLRSDLDTDASSRLDDLLDALDGLGKLRDKAENNTITRGGAFQAYNELVDPAYAFISSLSTVDDVELEKQGRALVGVTQAREYLSREDALMAAAYVAGQFTRGDQRALSDRVAERNIAYQTYLPSLPAEDRQTFEKYWDGTDGRTLRGYEDAVIAAGPRTTTGPVSAERWRSAITTALGDLDRMSVEAGERHNERVDPVARKVLIQAAAAGVLGALAVLASLIISIRVGRGLVRDLNTLRKEANESAGVRLPSVMRRLASGEQVDVETESPRLEYPPDEMGQVGQALNTLQRAAVEAAVKQAGMRRGVSEVFVNLARRNQVLLHRQLTLLDTMERRTEDADELADLFRLDHLTTRMRRHAEGLVILSGAAPSRQWRKPVQLMDVVRAAVAEVEDYERIEVRRLPRLAVDGSAVADLTHLIAELLENATVFSPPHTAVQVLGERVANGFTLEIHDRGLGMAPEALLDANLRLAETPEFELSDTDRLGLFVVSRLAQRQGVRVSLQPSPYGGTTAVVLIPGAVLTETPDRDDEVTAPRRTAIEDGTRRDEHGESPVGAAAGERELSGALAQSPAALLEGAGERRALGGPGRPVDGPVELEAPLDSLDGPDSGGRLFRKRERTTPPGVPAGEQHQQARDETETGPSSRTGETGEPEEGRPTVLPRRRPGAPVLVSDHGRPVENGRPVESGRPAQGGPAPLPRRRKPAPAAPTDQATDAAPSGPSTPSTPSARPPAPSPEAADVPEAPEPAPGPGSGSGRPASVGGLPRRVRQASLAPQLRTDGSSGHAPESGAGTEGAAPQGQGGSGDGAERDADVVRSRMASLQRGWERGRRHSESDTYGAYGAERDPGPSGDAAGESAQGTTPEGDGR